MREDTSFQTSCVLSTEDLGHHTQLHEVDLIIKTLADIDLIILPYHVL